MQARRENIANERGPLLHSGVPLLVKHAMGLQPYEGRILFQQKLGKIDSTV